MRNNKNIKFKRTEIGMIPSDWEVVCIKDIATNVIRGSGISRDDVTEEGLECIRYGELYTSYSTVITKCLSHTIKEKINSPKFINKGTIVFALTGESVEDIAKSSVYMGEDKCMLGGDICAIEHTQNPIYVGYAMETKYVINQKKFGKTKTKVVHSSTNEILNFKIAKPSKSEQEKIANALTRIDNLIEDYEKLIKKKEKIKQGLMKNLLTGKVRLKGFKDSWCKNRIKEIYTITRGQVLSTKKISKTISGINCYPVYSSQTANNGLLGYYDKYLFDTCITWTTDGENAGTVKYRKGKFYSTNVNGVLISKDNLCNECMSEIINMNTSSFIVRNGNPKLMNNVMAEIEICYPKDIKEQYAISQILTNADNEISDLKLKLDKIKNIKKGMMDNLLTGKIRL